MTDAPQTIIPSSAAGALEGPSHVYDGYRPGDIIAGGLMKTRSQKSQAASDYAAWVRSEASAEAQRNWEQYMSSTQAQRAMKDLEAAGLNPILAVQSAGFGQSTPVGSSGSSSAGGYVGSAGSIGQSMAGIGSAAKGIATLIKVIDKLGDKK